MKELLTMTPIPRAMALLDEAFIPVRKIEEIELNKGLGRELARDILASEQIPNFSRSTKDGYAVRAQDTKGANPSEPVVLQVVGEVQMGQQTEFSLAAGQAGVIPTGGMLPEGADAVGMLEYCQGPLNGKLSLAKELVVKENVVAAGEDVEVGDLLIPAGKRLRPQELGLLASQGMLKIPVLEKIRVGILSTGNEIVSPEKTPSMGEVRDINTYILEAEVLASGGLAKTYPIAEDDYDALKSLVAKALAENHLVLISGGSSVGAKDYCLGVLEELTGKPPLFHGIPLKPGKPALGASIEGKVILGLPGHPVSTRTVFDILVRPLLQTPPERQWKKLVEGLLDADVISEKGRHDHIKVRVRRVDDGVVVSPLVGVSSIVSLLTQADGEIIIPQGRDLVKKASQVLVHLY